MARLYFLLLLVAIMPPIDVFAQDRESQLEQSLRGYIATFRIEAAVLTGKIQNDETKRAYLKMVEAAIAQMDEGRKGFGAAARRYLERPKDSDLTGTLRLAIDANQQRQAYLQSILFSNSVMFGLASITQTYTDKELDKEMVEIITALNYLAVFFVTRPTEL